MCRFSKLLLFSFFFCKDGSDRLMKRASYSCCNFLCVVLAATNLKYRRCRLSCLPFVWHFFSLWHTHTHTCTHTRTHAHVHTQRTMTKSSLYYHRSHFEEESKKDSIQKKERKKKKSHSRSCVQETWTCTYFNPLSAIGRIYPSSKRSSQWPYDGYIRHGWMTSCGRTRDSATPECFGRGSQGTIFVRSSKISLFFPELCSFRRVFLFPALL